MQEEKRESVIGGRRHTDSCAGDDCPQYLKQNNKISKIEGSMYIVIALLTIAVVFQGITFKRLDSFTAKYNDRQIDATQIFGKHLADMATLEGRVNTVVENCANNKLDLSVSIQKNYNEFHEHMDKYHR